MADLTPTTDQKGPPKKTAIILLAAGGAALLYFIWKKKQEKIEYNQQSFVPVTAENIGGAGAQGGGFGSPGSGSENINALVQAQEANTKFITEFLKGENERREKQEAKETTLIGSILEKYTPGQPVSPVNNITGGGAPEQKQTGGQVGATGGGTTGNTKGGGCPSNFSLYNPKNGPPGIHSCYHISHEKAKKPGYVIHGYEDGHEVESR